MSSPPWVAQYTPDAVEYVPGKHDTHTSELDAPAGIKSVLRMRIQSKAKAKSRHRGDSIIPESGDYVRTTDHWLDHTPLT